MIPLLAIAIIVAAVAPAKAGAGAGTPPPSSSPGSEPSPTSVPPVITTPASKGPTKLTLVSQPPWVAAESALPLGLRIEGPLAPGMTIVATAYPRIETRTGYEAAMRGEQLRSGTQLPTPIPIDPYVPADAAGVRTLTLGLQSSTDRRSDRLSLRTTGADVFPVEIELRDAEGNQLSGFVTPVVVVAPGAGGTPTIGQPLNVAWVWPMADRPAFLLDGTADPEVVADLGSAGRIGGQALALNDHAVPVTIAPGPETLEAWQLLAEDNLDIAATLVALSSSLARVQILNSPYVPIDIPSLEAGGFEPEIGVELRKGADTLLSGLGVSADQGTAIVDPVDDAAVARLRTDGVSEFLVKDTALVPRADNLTPARPFLLRSDPRNVTAVASDSGLAQLLEGPDPPALRAQRFLAALSVIAVELPNVQRGVVVLNPAVDPPDLLVLNAALSGLAEDHPLLDPVKLDKLFDLPLAVDEPSGETVERELAPITPADPPVTLEQYRDTERALAGYTSLLPLLPTPLSARGERALFISLSSAWDSPEGRTRASAELDAVTAEIDQFVGGIHVPVNPTITVTASKAEIPVTFLNDTDPPQTVKVRVTLDSDELTFPDGPTRDLELPPRNTTFRFAVEARGSGTFPLSLRVTSPDGSLQLQQTEVQVRSTFVSNVGVFLTVGAVLFLALWWGNDFRRRRKRKAAAASPDPGTEAQPSSAAAPGAPR